MRLPKILANYAKKHNLEIARFPVTHRASGSPLGYTFELSDGSNDGYGNVLVVASFEKTSGENWIVKICRSPKHGLDHHFSVQRVANIRSTDFIEPDSRFELHCVGINFWKNNKINF